MFSLGFFCVLNDKLIWSHGGECDAFDGGLWINAWGRCGRISIPTSMIVDIFTRRLDNSQVLSL